MGGSVVQALFAMIMLRPLAKCELSLKDVGRGHFIH